MSSASSATNYRSSLAFPPSQALFPPPQQSTQNQLLEKAIQQITTVISLTLDTIEEIYANYHLHFHVQKDYVHRLFMTIVAPVELNIKHDVREAEYFTVIGKPNLKTLSKKSQHVDSLKKTLDSRFTKLCQRFQQLKPQKSQEESQTRPQMMSLLTKISKQPETPQASYYRGTSSKFDHPGLTTSKLSQSSSFSTPTPVINFQKNSLVYPTLKVQDDSSDDEEIDEDGRVWRKSANKQNCVLGAKLEQQISNWVVRELTSGKKVTRADLKAKALQMRENNAFKASRTWIRSYFKRYPHIKNLILQCQIQNGDNEGNDQISAQSQSQNINQQQSFESYAASQSYQNSQQNPPIKASSLNSIKKHKKKQSEYLGLPQYPVQHGLDEIGEQNEQMEDAQSQASKVKKINDGEKVIYDDGQEKIIIYKGITNEVKESKYTSGRRNKKSYVNGNGYSFKNHSRFKDAYFNDLTKSKQVSSVVIVKKEKESERSSRPTAKQRKKQKKQSKQKENERDYEIEKEQQKQEQRESEMHEKWDENVERKENGQEQKRIEEMQNEIDRGGIRVDSRSNMNNGDGTVSSLKSYLNLMRYETVKIELPKE